MAEVIDNNQLIKEGIIRKLKEYEAYIDNELPDYIMVMLANKKTLNQIANDLQLFLGDNIEPFMDWLHEVIHAPQSLLSQDASSNYDTIIEATIDDDDDEDLLLDMPTIAGVKRTRASQGEYDQSDSGDHGTDKELTTPTKMRKMNTEEDDEPMPTGVQRIKLPPEPKQERRRPTRDRERDREDRDKTGSSRHEDLRKVIKQRQASPATKYSDSEEEEENGGAVSSVVRLPTRQDRLKRSGGTSRLLQKAILDIHGSSKSSKTIKLEDNRSDDRLRRKQKKNLVSSKRKETVSEEVVDVEAGGFVDEFREESADPLDTSQYEEGEELPHPVEPPDTSTLLTKKEVATLAAVKKVLPKKLETSDLRQVLNKKEKSTRFVVTIDGASDKYKNLQTDEDSAQEQEDGGGRTLGERCRFWPNCKNGDLCPYHHPTTPCRLFPNCKYGQKCCFVHPVCKFDGRCMKPGCPYLHTIPVNKPLQPNMLPIPMMPQYRPVGSYAYGSFPGRGRGRFPNKAALTWTPEKSLSERNFSVPDSQTTSMPVQ